MKSSIVAHFGQCTRQSISAGGAPVNEGKDQLRSVIAVERVLRRSFLKMQVEPIKKVHVR